MSLRYAIATDLGRERENNEDAALAVPELDLFVIADGMGGHLGGEIASHAAVESVVAYVKGHGPANNNESQLRILCEAALEANSTVLKEAERRDMFGMGTTLTALQIRGRTATIVHVGDTRVSLLKDGEVTLLTRDQNVATMLVDQGVISSDAAPLHPERHMLTQAVGTHDSVEPDLVQTRVPKDARILLSTDGLHDVIPGHEIAQIAANETLEGAVRGLIDKANEHGGPDNITVLLIEL